MFASKSRISKSALPGESYESRGAGYAGSAERAKLAIHGLTSLPEPQKITRFTGLSILPRSPYMKLDARLTVKFMEDLPLLRIMTGSDLKSASGSGLDGIDSAHGGNPTD